MRHVELSDGAKQARSEYYRARYAANPGKHKSYELATWERKAIKRHGVNYIPPTTPGELSEQAKQERRDYYSGYRKRNAERIKAYSRKYQKEHKYQRKNQSKYMANYWERKAKEKLAT